MLNQIVIVGRLVKEVELEKEEKNVARITLAVPRSYKNADGEYGTDFIPCVLYKGIAQNTAEYCKKGDLIGVKGCIRETEGKIELIAEKITFLSSKESE